MNSSVPAGIPGYRLLRELGRGGMGSVWLAEQESLNREVALKLLSPHLAADRIASERFLREARIAAKLVDRHIVGIHDVGVHEGQPYLAMEYMPGGTVARAEGEAMAPAQALDVVRQIALALDRAHREGVIHRDLKPENILRRADGSYALADFGIARTLDTGGSLTQENTTLGTPFYMSPEQLQARPLDGRSDLYGLGVVLYQLLTGRLPYRGTDDVPVGIQHINAPVPRLPAALARYQELVDALMAKSPNARPRDGAEVARLIEALAAGASTPQGGAPTLALESAPAAPRSRGMRWLVGSFVGVIVAIALVLAWRSPQPVPPDQPPEPAAEARKAAPAQPSVAVLPLRSEGADAKDQYFSDGLSEDLITALGQIEGLRVISRNSSFRFRDAAEGSERIAGQLGVAHLVEGSVRRDGDAVRVNVSLVRGADGSTRWSRRFDRPYRDLFALQDEIVQEVIAALEPRLLVIDGPQGLLPSGPPVGQRDRPRDGNLAAYEALLRGNHEFAKRTQEATTAAIAFYEQALRLAPDYAQAWAQLGMATYALANFYSVSLSDRDALNAKAEHATDEALRLAPDLSQAHHGKAWILQGTYKDLGAAERELKRARELAPQDADVLARLANLQAQTGRFEESLATVRAAMAADPLAPNARQTYARTLLALRRFAEAEAEFQKVLVLRPGGSVTHANLAIVRALDGRPEAALESARAEVDPFWRDYALAIAYHAAGRRAESEAALAKIEREHAGDAAFQIAELHAQRGNREKMYHWLEVARTSGDAGVVETLEDPFFLPYRAEPRFIEFCRKVGLPLPAARAKGA